LASILNKKWDLNCRVHKNNNGYVISVPAKSLPVVQALLATVMHSSMLHKIGLTDS
jgi:hypothetical protein